MNLTLFNCVNICSQWHQLSSKPSSYHTWTHS